MKNKTFKKTIIAGLAGLVAAASGCAVSEFSPGFRPSQISSTHKQRNLYDLGQKIEGMINEEQPYYLDDETNTLYVHAKDYHATLDQFGIKPNGTFNELFETNRVEIKYKEPQSGEWIVEDQIVANDGTIDTLDFGSFSAFKTRQKLDDEITAVARQKYGSPDMEVLVKQITYPMADQTNLFLGFISLINSHNAVVTHIGAQPLSFAGALIAGPGMNDTKYAVMIKTNNINNLDKVSSRDSPDYIRRVIVMGPTGKIVGGEYEEVAAGHKDVVIGLSNRPWDNFQNFVGELAETLEVAGRVTGAYIDTRTNIDLIGHESLYIPSRQVPKTSKIGRFTIEANEFNGAMDASRGLRDRLQGK